MSAMAKNHQNKKSNEFTITRIIDAQCKLVGIA
jgi:hypothetical protein